MVSLCNAIVISNKPLLVKAVLQRPTCNPGKKITLNISAPYWCTMSYLVQQGAHTYKHVRSSRTCISPSSSHSLEERKVIQTIPYKLQTCTLLLYGKDFFPYVGQGIEKDRGLQQADSTLHHALYRHQQKAL